MSISIQYLYPYCTRVAVMICSFTSFIPSCLFQKEKNPQNALSNGNKPAPIYNLFLFSVTVTSPCLPLRLTMCTSKLNIMCCSDVLVPWGFSHLQSLVQEPKFMSGKINPVILAGELWLGLSDSKYLRHIWKHLPMSWGIPEAIAMTLLNAVEFSWI